MAEVNPCFVLSTQTHNSEILRSVIRSLRLGAGPVGATDLAVTAGGAMNVAVAFGRAVIDGSESVLQGSYVVYNDASVTKAVAASDNTNPRRDLVCARVLDQDYSGGSRLWQLAVITGTPAASPLLPALPANAIALADVLVPALSGSVSGGNITDLRQIVGLGTDATKLQVAGTAAVGSRLDVARLDHIHPIDLTMSKRIDSQTFTNVASVTVPPSGVLSTLYRNLRIKIKVRGTAAAATANLLLRLNGDSSALYSYENGQASLTTQTDTSADLATSFTGLVIPANTAPANSFAIIVIDIADYNNSADHKPVIWALFEREATGTGGMRYIAGGGIWLSTAAITTLVLSASANNITGRVDTYGEA